MKKLMFAATALAAGLAMADVTSANVVGYNTNGLNADSYNLIGFQFNKVGGDADGIDVEKIIKTTGIEPVSYDEAVDEGLGAKIMVRDELGAYTDYYYINDARDRSKEGKVYVTGWADPDGDLLNGSLKLPEGAGVWLRVGEAVEAAINFSGEVLNDNETKVDFIAGYSILCNPYPKALSPKNVLTEGVTAVSYDEAVDEDLGTKIMIRDADGAYTDYYYIEDARDRSKEGKVYVTGWADPDGDLLQATDTILPVGWGFWLKSDEAGSLTFKLVD